MHSAMGITKLIGLLVLCQSMHADTLLRTRHDDSPESWFGEEQINDKEPLQPQPRRYRRLDGDQHVKRKVWLFDQEDRDAFQDEEDALLVEDAFRLLYSGSMSMHHGENTMHPTTSPMNNETSSMHPTASPTSNQTNTMFPTAAPSALLINSTTTPTLAPSMNATSPANVTVQPSSSPVGSPTASPTKSPLAAGKSRSFNITNCDSYALKWLIDLQNTCKDFTTLAGCKCSRAKALFNNGSIVCAKTTNSPQACPSNCQVCKQCLELVGCPNIYG